MSLEAQSKRRIPVEILGVSEQWAFVVVFNSRYLHLYLTFSVARISAEDLVVLLGTCRGLRRNLVTSSYSFTGSLAESRTGKSLRW